MAGAEQRRFRTGPQGYRATGVDIIVRAIGAIIVTYFTRLPGLKLLGRGRLSIKMVIIANVLSLVIWAVVAGLQRNSGNTFAISAAYIYVLPQLMWLAIDIWRARGKPSRRS